MCVLYSAEFTGHETITHPSQLCDTIYCSSARSPSLISLLLSSLIFFPFNSRVFSSSDQLLHFKLLFSPSYFSQTGISFLLSFLPPLIPLPLLSLSLLGSAFLPSSFLSLFFSPSLIFLRFFPFLSFTISFALLITSLHHVSQHRAVEDVDCWPLCCYFYIYTFGSLDLPLNTSVCITL